MDIVERLRKDVCDEKGRCVPFNEHCSCGLQYKAADEIERLREALIEAEAELIYLRRHGKDGARWEANDSKDVWRDKARSALQQNGSE